MSLPRKVEHVKVRQIQTAHQSVREQAFLVNASPGAVSWRPMKIVASSNRMPARVAGRTEMICSCGVNPSLLSLYFMRFNRLVQISPIALPAY
jgi:hypothetical protein